MTTSAFAVASVSALLFAASANATTLLSFNTARSGNSSVTNSPYYATLRSDVAAQLPQYTLTSTQTLSAASLSGVDVLWIGTVYTNGIAVTLSAAEQSAMMSFVQAGGSAVLFTDNATFAGGAPAANASFLSPFGVTTTGTLPTNSIHNIVNQSNYIMNGAFGAVGSTLTSDFPGYFDTVPSSAVVLTRLQANNEVSGIWFPAGSLGPTSGNVIIFSDSGYRTTGGALSANYDLMYLNILAQVPAPATLPLLGIAPMALKRRRRA